MSDDSSHVRSVHHEPGTAPSALHTVIHLTLTTLHSGYYYYPHLQVRKKAQSSLFKFTQPGRPNTVPALGTGPVRTSCLRERPGYGATFTRSALLWTGTCPGEEGAFPHQMRLLRHEEAASPMHNHPAPCQTSTPRLVPSEGLGTVFPRCDDPHLSCASKMRLWTQAPGFTSVLGSPFSPVQPCDASNQAWRKIKWFL